MKRILITTALVAFSATQGFAQSTGSTDTGGGMQQGQMAPGETFEASELIGQRLYIPREGSGAGMQSGQSGQTGMQTEQTGQTGQSDEALAGDDTGMQQPSQDWEMVGEIDDVILDSNGEVVGLVVDSGGFLGMGADELRIPIQDVRFMPEGQNRQMSGDGTQQSATDGSQQDMDTQTMQTADAENQQMQGSGGSTGFTVIYTGDPQALEEAEPFDEERAAEMGETRGSQTWGGSDTGQYEQVDFSTLTTEDLLGAAVYGSNDDWIGEVSELAVSESGEIENAIIDVGGFLGIGEKPVALPMTELDLRRTDGDELRVYVNYTEDELDSMETWENDSDL